MKLKQLLSCAQLIGDAALCAFIILRVPYTEIDWKAYMQEVEGFLQGERNYYNLKGDTGPLVYPAGFVYIFSALYKIAGNGLNIKLMQWIFAGIYLFQLMALLDLYRKSGVNHFAMAALLSVSRRLHSIFILRCFNDAVAMSLAFFSFNFAVRDHWSIACAIFSLAVSVKMNVLLFAPGLLFLLWRASRGSFIGTAKYLSICAGIQVILGSPFLLSHPIAYLHRAFELSRVFTFKWSVNWSFLPLEIFYSKTWALFLLFCHIAVVLAFFFFIWKRVLDSPLNIPGSDSFQPHVKPETNNASKPLAEKMVKDSNITVPTKADAILFVLFTSNFVGIVFSRSLHYQFYSWYYPTLPFLLFQIDLPVVARLVILSLIEYAWNVYPPLPHLSVMLQVLHFLILVMLFFGLEKSWSVCIRPRPPTFRKLIAYMRCTDNKGTCVGSHYLFAKQTKES